MKRIDSIDSSEKLFQTEDLSLPSFSDGLESVLGNGKILQVDGTNVVRVPFGVRQARRERPARPNTWATLVLPLQPVGSPTPPPQAA